MAIPHCRVTAQSRANGESAIAKAAYDSCSILRDSGQAFDFHKKKGLVHEQMIFADGEKKRTRGQFWRAVEKAEKRYDACVSREIVFALPLELDQAHRLSLAREMSEKILKEYNFKAVDLCIHEPPPDKRKRTATSEENPHAHLHIPTRDRDGKKIRRFNGPGGCNPAEIKKIRKIFEEVTNRHLRAAGIKTQISVDTLETQLAEITAQLAEIKTEAKKLETSQPISPLFTCHYEDLKRVCKDDAPETDIVFRLACRLRGTGHDQAETAEIIDSFYHDTKFSESAAKAAFTSPKADKTLKKLAKWIPNWEKLEQAALMPDWQIKQEHEKCQKQSDFLKKSVNQTEVPQQQKRQKAPLAPNAKAPSSPSTQSRRAVMRA